jgi:glycosyltransferase involved in cell wall biosynthesis
MKILLINNYGAVIGGAERVSLILRDGLRARGHDARLFASNFSAAGAGNRADYACLGSGRKGRLMGPVNPWALRALRQVLRSFRPDLAHVRMFTDELSPFILPLLKGVPSLYHAGSCQAICPTFSKILPDGSGCRYAAGWACYRAGCISLARMAGVTPELAAWRRWRSVFIMVVANSRWLGDRLRDDGLEVAAVIHNGTAIRAARPPLQNPPTVTFAGTLAKKKGVDVLVRAMAPIVAQLPAARLLIAGQGSQRPEIEALTAALGLGPNVTMLGYLESPRLDEALAPGWVHVVPTRHSEPFANTALEAMMRGAAVVASANGGMPEMVRDGQTGYLVPEGDVEALAQRMLALLTNRELAEQMGAAGRRVALAEYTDDRMIDRFVDLYAQILDRRAPA